MKRETYLLTEVGIEKASILIDSLEENGIDSKTILEKNVGAKAMKGNNLLSAESEIEKCIIGEGAQIYGIFEDDMLVSVMTATFCMVFPCGDSPSGRIVHISGAYTLPAYRHRHHATALLTKIQAEAVLFGADYLCCDSTADGLYLRFGMEPTAAHETRMWKKLSQNKEAQQ